MNTIGADYQITLDRLAILEHHGRGGRVNIDDAARCAELGTNGAQRIRLSCSLLQCFVQVYAVDQQPFLQSHR